MSTFESGNNTSDAVDAVSGNKVKAIIQKYLHDEMSEELTEKIMEDVKSEFGENHPAKIMLDTDTNNIEITIRDINGNWMKCSSITLFPAE